MKTPQGKIIGLAMLSLSFGCGLSYSQTIPCFTAPSGIVAWYRAETNTVDTVNGNNGTFLGSPSYASGEVGQAFDFNGSSYVSVPDAPQIDFTNTMTVEAWVNLRTYSGANSREIVSKFGSSGPLDCWTLAIDPPTKKAYYVLNSFSPGISIQLFSSTIIPTNQWVHIAGVADGSQMKIYVNGELSNSTNWTYGIHTTNSPVTIGCTMQFVPTSYFNGQIDEVSLYNTALSDCDIQSIYLVGPQGKCH
jgi:Concanavalin A-like lectin/glucanases superfamily